MQPRSRGTGRRPSRLTARRPRSPALGDWYAAAVFWRPQVCLLVNEATLLPVLVPLAPAATLAERFANGFSDVLTAHGAGEEFIEAERAQMAQVRLAKTSNRSVVDIMNEFSFPAEAHLSQGVEPDLLGLSLTPMKETQSGPSPRRDDGLYGKA
jgi:hypothetical protein